MKFKEYINESKELRKYFDDYVDNMFDNAEDLPSSSSFNLYNDENWKGKSLQQRWKSFVDHARKGAYVVALELDIDFKKDKRNLMLKMNPSASDKKLFMKRQEEFKVD